jgi:hypothetical protein
MILPEAISAPALEGFEWVMRAAPAQELLSPTPKLKTHVMMAVNRTKTDRDMVVLPPSFGWLIRPIEPESTRLPLPTGHGAGRRFIEKRCFIWERLSTEMIVSFR